MVKIPDFSDLSLIVNTGAQYRRKLKKTGDKFKNRSK